MAKQRVLILCTANSARSQMAEALLRHKAGDRFDVFSAGVEPATVNPFAIAAMQDLGVSMDGHTSKHLDQYLGKVQMHYVITVCDSAAKKCPAIWPGVCEILHWPFEDPAAVEGDDEAKLAKFREVRDQISAKFDEWLAQLPAE
jgi:arsenate reductase